MEPFRPEVHVAPGLVSAQAPYLVGLIETENPETIICAGSLLNYRWVITLASCTVEKKHDKRSYKVGIFRQASKNAFYLILKSNRSSLRDLMTDRIFSSQSK